MNSYSTSSDHRYPDSLANTAIPQATAFWHGGPDGSQSAVTRNSDDRYGPPPRLRANQLPTSTYASTAAFPITQRDSYPAQTQSDCSGRYPYPLQQYRPVVNYASGPFDLAEYPIVPGGGNYPSGQYATQVSSATNRIEYLPSDPTHFHNVTYDNVGHFSVDGFYCSPLDGQHQQSLLSDPSGYSRCDGSFNQFAAVGQHSIVPIPPSSSSSELGNALVEVRTSIALPSLPLSTQPTPKHESSESAVGVTTVKTEHGTTASGQPFSPMTPLGHSPSLTDPTPYIKEEEQEQRHVGNSSMQRPSSPLHGHGSLRHRQQYNFVVQENPAENPAAYRGFAPPKRHPPPPSLSIPGPLSYSPGTPVSSSFSSDTGTPTSGVNLIETVATSSSLPQATLVPNPKAGQGVLKLPSTKRSARRKPAIACLFCRERKIACGAPPVGSADTTCNQCARRSRKCEYPTMSRRGLHKRRDNGGSHHRESEDADYVPTT